MSRCTACLLAFDEENGWQEFCSVECAMTHVVGRMLSPDDEGKASKAWKKWDKWFSDPRNRRLVRIGGQPAKHPEIGRFRKESFERTYVKGRGKDAKVVTETVTRLVNVGSEIVCRPMTQREKDAAAASRGRGSFGENMIDNQTWRDLPSAHGRIGQAWFPHDE